MKFWDEFIIKHFNAFYMLSNNDMLVTVNNKSKHAVVMMLFSVLYEIWYYYMFSILKKRFLTIQGPTLNGSYVAISSEVCIAAMLVLMLVKNSEK